jgi:membrane fusion protein (multidrug efflux system)
VSTDDAQVEPEIYPVSPRVGGHVLAVFAEENQQVKAGDVLVEIDPTDYRVGLEQATAALAQAEWSAKAATGTVRVTEQTGGAGISQAEAGLAGEKASEAASERGRAAAVSQVESAQAAEKAAEAAVEMAVREVASARAALTSAKANAGQARTDGQRMEALAAQGAVSAQQRDAAAALAVTAAANVEAAEAMVSSAEAGVAQARERLRQAALAVRQAGEGAAAAEAQVRQAQAAVAQAEAQVRSSQASPAQVGVRRSEAGSAGAQVAAAKARVEQAKLNLAYTRIVAAVDGVVAEKNVKPGQFVQAGQSLIAIVANSEAHLLANFKETQLARIRPGQRATFTLDAYPGVTFHGRVVSLSPGTGSVFSLLPPENASGNFTKVVQRVPVRLRVEGEAKAERPLRAGMSVVVTIDVG